MTRITMEKKVVMHMSKKIVRANKIMEILKEKKGSSVKELAALLHVSEMTVRRDLSNLEDEGCIKNVLGVAIYEGNQNRKGNAQEYELSAQQVLNEAEKMRIGKMAATLIHDEDTIIIDNGTTTEMLARYLPDHLKVTTLFYSINIMQALKDKPNIEMIFTGGYFRPNTQMFESPEGLEIIKKTRATKVFLSAAGVHKELGITCANDYELLTKKVSMQSAHQKILLVDSSKFDTIKASYISEISELHTIITDKGITNEWVEYIKNRGIELICV